MDAGGAGAVSVVVTGGTCAAGGACVALQPTVTYSATSKTNLRKMRCITVLNKNWNAHYM